MEKIFLLLREKKFSPAPVFLILFVLASGIYYLINDEKPEINTNLNGDTKKLQPIYTTVNKTELKVGKKIRIGKQTYPTFHHGQVQWLAKNLALPFPQNGTSFYQKENKYGRIIEYKKKGMLYTQKAASKACKMIGEGWRLPTNRHWSELLYTLAPPESNDTEKFGYDRVGGFGALIKPGEKISFNGNLAGFGFWSYEYSSNLFYDLDETGYLWTSDVTVDGKPIYFALDATEGILTRQHPISSGDINYFSCRCVKDNRPIEQQPQTITQEIAKRNEIEKARNKARSKQRRPKTTYVYTSDSTYRIGWTVDDLNLVIDSSYVVNTSFDGRANLLYTFQSASKACSRLGKGWRLPDYSDFLESFPQIYKNGGIDRTMGFLELKKGGGSKLDLNLMGMGLLNEQGFLDNTFHKGSMGVYWITKEGKKATLKINNTGKLAYVDTLDDYFGSLIIATCRCVKKSEKGEKPTKNRAFKRHYDKTDTRKIGKLTWTTENIQECEDECYPSPKQPWIAKPGFLYSFEGASKACQKLGEKWRIPTEEDIFSLISELLKKEHVDELNSNHIKSASFERLMSNEDTGFNMFLSGYGKIHYGEVQYQGFEEHGGIWFQDKNGNGGILHLDKNKKSVSINKEYSGHGMLFSCRCVQNSASIWEKIFG